MRWLKIPHDHGALLQLDEVIDLTLGTLGAKIAILSNSNVDTGRNSGFHIIWVNIAGFFSGKTTTEGPILIGFACNVSAIELAAILADDPQAGSDPTKTGPGSWYHPLLLIGVDAVEGAITPEQGATNVQAQSHFHKIMVKWTVPENNAFSMFAYNLDTGALTTGMAIKATIQFFGAWLRD